MANSGQFGFDRDGRAGYQTVPRPDTAVIDAGLRAYMLRVYNYMALGLVITGVAAVVVYMLSVTGDAAVAAKIVRGGIEGPVRITGTTYLTAVGYALFVSPVKWLIILSPLAFILVLSFGL